MTRVFADTLYWVAVTRPGDPWGDAARRATSRLGTVRIVTTDEVLAEFLTAMSRGGPAIRAAAVEIVRRALANLNVEVIPQSRESFLQALDRYASRSDKRYSLTDCSSMNTMDALGIHDILTNDHHFEQEGYNVLIRK
ncbi:MAG: PIN domain-containing protein [Planctomycetes bacterium]|nr:PIN domain-containing protein [Planctomycetota bacterium]